MDSELPALQMPAFELDCRDWLVSTPDDGSVPEEIAGAPVVAVLSTAVIGTDDIVPASAVLSVGLADDEADALPYSRAGVAELIDRDEAAGSASYIVPAPDGRLALLAEFSADGRCRELMSRFEQLMASFRWAS